MAARCEAVQVADKRFLRGASSSSTSTRPLAQSPVKGKGKTSNRDSPRFDIFADHKCTCEKFNGEFFCTSMKCRNNIHLSCVCLISVSASKAKILQQRCTRLQVVFEVLSRICWLCPYFICTNGMFVLFVVHHSRHEARSD